MPFDRDADGKILLGLEAAHSRHRIVHAGGDSSGREIILALAQKVRATPSITVIERIAARRLIVEDNAIVGILANTHCGPVLFKTNRVVIATGGIGGLFVHGTNPAGSFGQGLSLAARAGAVLADLEFVQFHPTALNSAAHPMALISETVRGEGALLIDEAGERFMADQPGAELAARDIVARAVWHHMMAGHHVFLDARKALGSEFPRRFPAITKLCRAAGIDPVTAPIPIRPAAHYHMGGIKVDHEGRSSVQGLWACGEAACTGLHGANRLASNSLLEAAVCARFVAESLTGYQRVGKARHLPPVAPLGSGSDPAAVRSILSHAVGVLRDSAGLRDAASALLPLALSNTAPSDPALVGLMIAVAALRREESRGAHSRTDFPRHDPAFAQSLTLRLDDALTAARELASDLVA